MEQVESDKTVKHIGFSVSVIAIVCMFKKWACISQYIRVRKGTML